MSHSTVYEIKIKNAKLFCEVAKNLGHKVKYDEKNKIEVQQFSRNVIHDCQAEVHLNGWGYPLAIKPNGDIYYDHFGSKTDTMQHLGKALQEYNKKLILNKAMMQDYIQNYSSKMNANGEVVITLEY